MHCLKKQRMSPNSELEHLIEYIKNEELKRILATMHVSEWVGDNGMTLLHLAVVHNNHEMVKYLLDIGCAINAKNSSGDTALLIAMKSRNFEAAKILLDEDADVRPIDSLSGQSALGILIAERQRYFGRWINHVEDIAPHFVNNLKRSTIDANVLIDLLVAAEWPLEYVLPMNDAQLTRKFLERNPTGQLQLGMELAMKERNYENIELILRHGNNLGRQTFHRQLLRLLFTNEMQLWRDLFVRYSSDWDVIDEEDALKINFMFSAAKEENLKMLLDSKIDVRIKEKFGVDVRTFIFGNRKVDAIKLLKNENFNVNVPGFRQYAALHVAVLSNLPKNVYFLLDSGADVNAKNDMGRTALFDSLKPDSRTRCGQVLLAYGADVHVVDKNGQTVLELAQNENSSLIDYIVAKLAIDSAQGVTINQAIQNRINSNEDHKKIYETCCQQLQNLRNCNIVDTITLFDVLARKVGTLRDYVPNFEDHVFLIHQFKNRGQLHKLYYIILTEKLADTWNLYSLKCDIANIISKRTGNLINFDHLAVSKIAGYLTKNDINTFNKYSIQLKNKK